MGSYIWSSNSRPNALHFLVALYIALCFPVARLSLSLFYMCQCGFYIYIIVALLTWETRRKDFAVMMSHHVITTILISYSYVTSFFRIGSIVLSLHDASDVFLEAAKILKYTGKELGASVCFGLFSNSWLVLRLIIFPFWVIKSSSYDVMEFLRPSASYPKFLYYFLNTMLLMLLVFHVYWWVLICTMIMRQWQNRGKVGEDIRSSDGFIASMRLSSDRLQGCKARSNGGDRLAAGDEMETLKGFC
ncbi:LAG1 longevity assurance homolog 2-like [Hibiscus syriacus]|uniref:LAG1 longevity assurance homolog 2-like n=1 Tax=Hibiscus syriacus TaxID=106335 RepID=UPI0019212BBC|nr:LAG1 longevity assurance homolog 2-like [Hibiscus syriacus]